MDIKDIQKWKAQEKKDKVLYVRIPIKSFQWLKENKVSITKFVNYSLEEVMKQKNNNKTK